VSEPQTKASTGMKVNNTNTLNKPDQRGNQTTKAKPFNESNQAAQGIVETSLFSDNSIKAL
jgi:hypothetical protein